MKIFRFDDICINSDMKEVNRITDYLLSSFDCEVIWAVSPLVSENVGERVFPKILGAFSDVRTFYFPDKSGMPELRKDVTIATHGLIHADHRLLTKEAQEMSILVSSSLCGNAKMFVPPFNKWNKDTQSICDEWNIELIKFEDGWLSMEHNPYMDSQKRWYLHHRDMNLDQIKEWIH